MGWFFETENDRRKKRIVSYAEEICVHMRKVTRTIEQDGGITYENRGFVLSELQSIVPLKDKMESEIMELPQAKINSLYLPWVDGRNIPFHLWAATYQMGATQIQNMINGM